MALSWHELHEKTSYSFQFSVSSTNQRENPKLKILEHVLIKSVHTEFLGNATFQIKTYFLIFLTFCYRTVTVRKYKEYLFTLPRFTVTILPYLLYNSLSTHAHTCLHTHAPTGTYTHACDLFWNHLGKVMYIHHGPTFLNIS